MNFWIIYLAVILILAGRYRWTFAENWFPEEKVNNWRLTLAVLILIVISAIRYEVGADWKTYDTIVYEYSVGFIYFKDVVPTLLFLLSAKVGNFSFIAFAILALITYGSIGLWAKKDSIQPNVALMVYFALFYLRSLSIIREAAAVAILIWGYRYIREKSIWKYILVCVAAAMFHKYALVGLVLYFLYYLPITALVGVLVLLWVAIQALLMVIPKISFLANSVVSQYLLGFANYGGLMNTIFFVIIILFCLLLILWAWRTQRHISEEIEGTFKICLVGTVLPFIFGTHTGGRIADYFLIYLMVLIPLILEEYSKRFQSVVMLGLSLYYVVQIYVDATAGSGVFTPYQVYYWIKI